MSKKSILNGILFSILMTSFIFLVGFTNNKKLNIPKELYQVYIDGKLIGVIENENDLYKMIDNKQEELKKEFNVDKIYPPNSLETNKIITYDTKINSVKEVYDIIKKTEPFTVSGYQITINYKQEGKEPIVFNVLYKEDFEKAVMNTVEAFVDETTLNQYLDDKQEHIETDESNTSVGVVGRIIDNIKLKEDITIKKTYIPTDSKIFTTVDEINRFLLFGNNTESQKYTIKMGDTISSVANQSKLNVSEFLIVNPSITSENALLFPGQEVNIELINPIVTVAVEKTVVENMSIAHKTIVEYDNNISYGITNIKQEGSDGVSRTKYLYHEENGQIVDVSSNEDPVVLVEARDEIIVKGGNRVFYVGDSTYWAWPTLTPFAITSLREWRWGRWHAGLDIAGLPTGAPIFAIQDGTVVTSTVNFGTTGYGNYVVIDHHNGYYSLYAHMFDAPYVQLGQEVKKGDVIGGMGSTGNSTGTHLHFEVHTSWPLRQGTTDIDPRIIYQ